MATKRKRQGGIPLFQVRDAVSIAVGAFLLVYQALIWRINPYLVGAALTLLGFPSIVGAVNELRASKNTQDTTDSSSDSPSPSVSPR